MFSFIFVKRTGLRVILAGSGSSELVRAQDSKLQLGPGKKTLDCSTSSYIGNFFATLIKEANYKIISGFAMSRVF